ncbi:MAG TPA: alkaline phosphatase family protein, partial [Gemmatimonadaceae bacterium]|nr:alkaline phosphatase family protein [Gemmatimonadaceae bacterium]
MTSTASHDRTLLLIVADGVRPDVLGRRLAEGHLPNLAARRARGALYEVSSVFPSVTGPAYAPFLMGRFPAQVGIPGLRWFDRARERCRIPPFARSYSGPEIWWLDHDLDPGHPTLLELATPSVAGASMLGRGARGRRHPGRGVSWMLRAMAPHFRGDLAAWRRLEGEVAHVILGHLRRRRPRIAVMAFLLPDKFAHKYGADTPPVHASLGDLDAFVGEATEIARRNGWEDRLDVWVVADHGHATVTRHDDIADSIRDGGWRVLA